MAKQEKFDPTQPGQYVVVSETPTGQIEESAPMSYADTNMARHTTEDAGNRVTGIVKNPK